MIDDELRELAGLLAGHVPAVVISGLVVSMDAYEAEVGLEQLCDTMPDEEAPLTPAGSGTHPSDRDGAGSDQGLVPRHR
jgi:hypothetical protein